MSEQQLAQSASLLDNSGQQLLPNTRGELVWLKLDNYRVKSLYLPEVAPIPQSDPVTGTVHLSWVLARTPRLDLANTFDTFDIKLKSGNSVLPIASMTAAGGLTFGSSASPIAAIKRYVSSTDKTYVDGNEISIIDASGIHSQRGVSAKGISDLTIAGGGRGRGTVTKIEVNGVEHEPDVDGKVELPDYPADLTEEVEALQEDVEGKQDIISDLSTIRSNASAGKTASDNLGGHTVAKNVPSDAKFTDTVYDDTAVKSDINTIKAKIPTEATSTNKLADKDFVNSSITTNTATFRGTSAENLTEAQFLTWANGLTKTKNDYIFWNTKDSNGNVVYKRYKYNGTAWVYEYTLNNSSFTASQWATIQSGLTSTDKSNLDAALALIATFGDIVTHDASEFATPSDIKDGLLTIKQNGISKGTFGANESSNKTIELVDTTYESKSAASGGTAVSLVTTGEKYSWNNKYVKPSTGIPKTDLASAVQTSLGRADTALQQHQSLDGYVNNMTADTTTTTFTDTTTIAVSKSGKNLLTRTASSLFTYIQSKLPSWSTASTKPTYTKSEVGLGNVDNTSDANKPISTATQTALDGKQGTLPTGNTVSGTYAINIKGSAGSVGHKLKFGSKEYNGSTETTLTLSDLGGKPLQTPISGGQGGTTKTLTGIAQNASGVITPTFADIPTAANGQKGLIALGYAIPTTDANHLHAPLNIDTNGKGYALSQMGYKANNVVFEPTPNFA